VGAHARSPSHGVVEDVGHQRAGDVPPHARRAAGRSCAARASREAHGDQHFLCRVRCHVRGDVLVSEHEDGGKPLHRVPTLLVLG
jgi:hypothetical protein